MSAKLVLTVKDSNQMAKGLSMSIMDKMFHPLKYNKMMNSKAKIGIFIDDEKEGTLYEASKTPYEISLTPGVHRISMIDPAKDSKKGNVNLMGVHHWIFCRQRPRRTNIHRRNRKILSRCHV